VAFLVSIPFWSDFNEIHAETQKEAKPVSIPFWSDFNASARRDPNYRGPVSIPFWSDFNGEKTSPVESNHSVSIPFWSDFNQEILEIIIRHSETFQSHFGLILTQSRVQSEILSTIRFNPILV